MNKDLSVAGHTWCREILEESKGSHGPKGRSGTFSSVTYLPSVCANGINNQMEREFMFSFIIIALFHPSSSFVNIHQDLSANFLHTNTNWNWNTWSDAYSTPPLQGGTPLQWTTCWPWVVTALLWLSDPLPGALLARTLQHSTLVLIWVREARSSQSGIMSSSNTYYLIHFRTVSKKWHQINISHP